jgi:hypothetical protein
MKRFHLAIGIVAFVVFCVTGRLMRIDFPDKELIGADMRLLMRSRHIYILFSSLIHLGLGIYAELRPTQLQRMIQIAASAVLTISTAILCWAWYVETYQTQHFTDVSRWGIYLSLTGIGLHLLGGLPSAKAVRTDNP